MDHQWKKKKVRNYFPYIADDQKKKTNKYLTCHNNGTIKIKNKDCLKQNGWRKRKIPHILIS